MSGRMKPDETTIRAVRIGIYAAIERTGGAPDAPVLARALSLEVQAVEDALHALADAHVIVLHPGTAGIKWAPPFASEPTAFRVRVGRESWHAPCAWDAFGIPAALDRDARIEATCAWSGEPVPAGVEHGLAYGDGVIHLLVPAAHFWDDIAYT
jgi:Alkylmercury lyase